MKLSFSYPKVTLKPTIVSKVGSFSRYDSASNILYIGDGETVTMNFDLEEKINWNLSSSRLDKRVSNTKNTKLTNGISNQVVIKNTEDTVTQEYLIPVWYVPMGVKEIVHTVNTQNGPAETITYENADNQLDPKTNFSWKKFLLKKEVYYYLRKKTNNMFIAFFPYL